MLPILHSSHLASVLRDVIQQEFISYIAAVKDKKATRCGEKTRSEASIHMGLQPSNVLSHADMPCVL